MLTIIKHQPLLLYRYNFNISNSFKHKVNLIASKRILSTTSDSSKKSQTSKLIPIILGTTTITITASILYLQNYVGGTEGLYRTISFYSKAVPKYIQYRYHQVRESPEETWNALHKETSQMGLDKILELRGFYIKSGQMVAANVGNGFPPIWQDTMSILQDQVPHEDFSVMKSILEKELQTLGLSISQVFKSIDETPIGAASIGQVHRAVLSKTGEKVVIKIMYPQVEALFRGDVRTIKLFAEIAQPIHVPALREIEKQFEHEFDYQKEAFQMEKIGKNMRDLQMNVIVPKPFLDYCTKRVLVMEELEGEKLAVALKENATKVAQQLQKTPEELFKISKELSTSEYQKYLSLLKKRDNMYNLQAFLYNSTIAWWNPFTSYQTYKESPINISKLMDELLYIHGVQVLKQGYFNADPHPGNILYSSKNKKLGLIDYGQVGQISKPARILLCQLILALANDDKPKIIKLMKKANFKSANMNEDVIYKYAKVNYDEDNDELTEGMHIQVFVEELQRRDPISSVPEEWLLVQRCSVLLRGMGHVLGHSKSVAKAWQPIAEQVLKQEGLL